MDPQNQQPQAPQPQVPPAPPTAPGQQAAPAPKKYSINIQAAPAFEGMPTEKEAAAEGAHKIFPKEPEKAGPIKLRGYEFITPPSNAAKPPEGFRLPHQGENSTGDDPYREQPIPEKRTGIPLPVSKEMPAPVIPRQRFERVIETPAGPAADSLPRIKTFEGDVANMVKDQKTSLLKIAMAEQKKKGTDGLKNIEPPRHTRSMLMISALCIIVGIGLLTGVYFFLFHKSLPGSGGPNIIQVIPVDTQKEIEVAGKDDTENASEKLKAEEAASISDGTIKKIVFTETDIATRQKKTLTTEELFTLFKLRAPAPLVRALGPDYTLGTYGESSPAPFLILNPLSFEVAFPGMLGWESTMYTDMSGIFLTYTAPQALPAAPPALTAQTTASTSKNVATSTKALATSTTPAATSTALIIPTPKPAFEDVVIKNTNARVLKNSSGDILFLYSFPDKDHLIITTSEAALLEILTRLTTAAKIVR